MAVYSLIAEAESNAHGVPVTEIHFHEVGTMDAIADIAMVCMLMDRLAPDEVVVSPVHVGSGQVHCAHGILPVPACHGLYFAGCAGVWRTCAGRTMHTHRGGIAETFCQPIRGHAGDEGSDNRLWYGEKGF